MGKYCLLVRALQQPQRESDALTRPGLNFCINRVVPNGAHASSAFSRARDDSWKHFVDLAYWNVELTD